MSRRQRSTRSLGEFERAQRARTAAQAKRAEQARALRHTATMGTAIFIDRSSTTTVMQTGISATLLQSICCAASLARWFYCTPDQRLIFDFCRPDGSKKAFVRLTPEVDALDIANKVRRLIYLQRFSSDFSSSFADRLHLILHCVVRSFFRAVLYHFDNERR